MYDIIVIGSDLSSWLAAFTAVKRGMKTVVLFDDEVPDYFRESGYAFPVNAFPLSGLGIGQTCRSLMEEIDPGLAGGFDFRLLNPGLQIISKELRVEIFHERERLLGEIAREFPLESGVIARFYDWLEKNRGIVLPQNAAKPSRDLDIFQDFSRFMKVKLAILQGKEAWLRVVFAARKVPALNMLFESQRTAFSYQYGNSGGFLSMLRILSRPLEGVYAHEGNMTSFRDELMKRYVAEGGTVIAPCSVMKITTGKETLVNIIKDGQNVKIPGRYLIVSTKWEKMKRLMLDAKAFRRLNRRFSRIKAFHYPFTLHMGVYGKGLPEKMGVHAVLLGEKGGPLCSDGAVFLECSLPDDRARAPEGRRALSATVFLKETPLRLTNEELNEAAEHIWKNMEAFLPFIGENLNFIDIEKSIALSRKHQETINSRVELKNGILRGAKLIVKTPVKNVFITGGMLSPHLGWEGEILSGIKAAYYAINEGRK